MKLLSAVFLGLFSGLSYADTSVEKSNILKPEDLGIYKWDVASKTTKETTFVMRFQHYVDDKLLWDYEEFFYRPKRTEIGSLLVFRKPEAIINLPTGNIFSFSVCNHIVANEISSSLKCIDGEEREAKTIEVKGADYHKHTEKVLIHFYSAPMKIFTDRIADSPIPSDNNSFRWMREISPMITVTSKETNGVLKLEYTDWSKVKKSNR